jgi:hypothetical protein
MKEDFEKTIEDSLKSSFVEPDQQWENNTLDKLVILVDNESEVFESKHLTINNYLYIMNKKNLFLGGISVIALSVLVILTAVVIINRLQNGNGIRMTQLSPAELNALYTKIADANPTFNSEATVAKNSSADADMEAALSSYVGAGDSKLIAPYYGTENVLYTNKYTNSYGPAVGSCSTFGYYGTYKSGDTEVSESYNIMTGGYLNSSSTVKRDGGTVTSFYSSIANANSNIAYEYQGGKFAVKFTYPIYEPMGTAVVRELSAVSEGGVTVAPAQPTTAVDPESPDTTVSSPVMPPEDQPQELSEDPTTRIKQLFGENAGIIGMLTENGKDYYVVESTYDVNCTEQNYRILSISSEQPTVTNKVINHYKIDTETYLVADTTIYLDNANENNMISVSKTETSERAVGSFGEVSSLFLFPYSVPVREIVVPEYDPGDDIDVTRNIIQTKNVSIIKPNNADLIADSVTLYDHDAQNNMYAYAADRDFYPDGEVGDRIYDMYTGGSALKYDAAVYYEDGTYYPTSLGYVYFNSTDFAKSLSYTIYEDKEKNYDNLLAVLRNGKTNATEANIEISIDGNAVTALSITNTYEGFSTPGFDPGRETTDPAMPESITMAPTSYTEVLFKYNGMIYQISSYSADNSINISTLSYETLGSAELESIFTTMLSRYTQPEILY